MKQQQERNQMVVDEKRLTVKVHNDIMEAVHPLKGSELDLFFAIMAKMKDKGDTLVEIPIDKLIEITHYKRDAKHFYQDCRDLPERLSRLPMKLKDGSKVRYFHVFNEVIVDLNTGALSVQIHDTFVYALNELKRYFTSFELEEYVRLEGVHARKMYLLLKQWRKTGGRLPDGKNLLFSIKDVRAAFHLSDKYKTADIESKIIKPILPQIEKIFHNFNYTVVKGGQGNTIIGYHFTFTPEARKEYITAPAKALPPKTTPAPTATQQPAADNSIYQAKDNSDEEQRKALQSMLGDF